MSDGQLSLVFSRAQGAATGTRLDAQDEIIIGSEHLLAAALGNDDKADEALSRVLVTAHTVTAIIRGKPEWSVTEGGKVMVPPTDLGRPVENQCPPQVAVTTVVDQALTRARDNSPTGIISPRELLAAMLAVEPSRAGEVIRLLGADPARARELLTHPPPVPPAPPPGTAERSLGFIRAVMLGRASYRPRSHRHRTIRRMIDLVHTNWAEVPVVWAAFEAEHQALRDGRRAVSSDDFLLATLGINEIATECPALLPANADHLYAGARVLSERGVSYHRALEARDQLAAEPSGRSAAAGRGPYGFTVTVEVKPHRPRRRTWRAPPDTQTLLRMVIHPPNRAARILTDLGVTGVLTNLRNGWQSPASRAWSP